MRVPLRPWSFIVSRADFKSAPARLGFRLLSVFSLAKPCRTQLTNTTQTMPQACYHPSVEGAQHGGKGLADFLDYAKRSGAAGAQPSNYMLQGGKLFKTAKE